MSEFAYVGQELDLFARAHNWKRYLSAEIGPYLNGDVLEVSAGIGAVTKVLATAKHRSWLCLEPDRKLAEVLQREVAALSSGVHPQVIAGDLRDAPAGATFDSVLYVDVLEHIEQDAAELTCAAGKLKPGGHLVVLAPAHNALMSEFDRAVGHHRRYDASMLSKLTPQGFELVRLRYLDSCGALASVANRLLLRQSLPTHAQIAFWDQRLVPLSRRVDPWLAHRVGKSILAVWRRA